MVPSFWFLFVVSLMQQHFGEEELQDPVVDVDVDVDKHNTGQQKELQHLKNKNNDSLIFNQNFDFFWTNQQNFTLSHPQSSQT